MEQSDGGASSCLKQLKSFIPKYDEYSWHPLMSGVIIEVHDPAVTKRDETAANSKRSKVEGNDREETQNRQERPLKSQKRDRMIKNDQTWCRVTTINIKILLQKGKNVHKAQNHAKCLQGNTKELRKNAKTITKGTKNRCKMNTKQAEHNFKWQKRCKTITEAQKTTTYHILHQNVQQWPEQSQQTQNVVKWVKRGKNELQTSWKCTKHSI